MSLKKFSKVFLSFLFTIVSSLPVKSSDTSSDESFYERLAPLKIVRESFQPLEIELFQPEYRGIGFPGTTIEDDSLYEEIGGGSSSDEFFEEPSRSSKDSARVSSTSRHRV